MLLEPSRYIQSQAARQLLGAELLLGGHGQVPISGNPLQIPSPGYNFYAFYFTSASVISSVVWADYYTVSMPYSGVAFPAGFTWYAPSSGISLQSGTAIAYQYARLTEPIFNSNNQSLW